MPRLVGVGKENRQVDGICIHMGEVADGGRAAGLSVQLATGVIGGERPMPTSTGTTGCTKIQTHGHKRKVTNISSR